MVLLRGGAPHYEEDFAQFVRASPERRPKQPNKAPDRPHVLPARPREERGSLNVAPMACYLDLVLTLEVAQSDQARSETAPRRPTPKQ